jgi:aspartate-semialdehyde dehydrogenase
VKALRGGVVGAAGAVGSRVIEVLSERRFPLRELRLMATARSAGREVVFDGERLRIAETHPESFSGLDLVFLAVPGSRVSRELVPEAVRRGCTVIDKGSAFRMSPGVPLVVPEVNPEALAGHSGIIASPNCSTIQLVVALAPLMRAAGLARVMVSTYQAASGVGQGGMEELRSATAEALRGGAPDSHAFPRTLAFNVVPQCDAFSDGGFTVEELKLTRESRKILDRPDLPLAATAVRVPVFVGHGESVYLETERPLGIDAARGILRQAPGVLVLDDPATGSYPTPLDAAGRDEVMVGRLRSDPDFPAGLHLWIAADNLRKGAATNAVQIAETLMGRGQI